MSHLDKVVHAFFYFVLTFLVQLNWKVNNLNWSSRTQAVVSVVVTILFGVLIEILQETCTASRHADVLDVIANSIGALLSVFAFKLYVRFKNK
ncbi:MAG: VanZ family protein [Flavobacterium sp.]